MGRPAKDPSGIDGAVPKDKVSVYFLPSVRRDLEARWLEEKGTSANPSAFPGIGTWLGERAVEGAMMRGVPAATHAPAETIIDSRAMADLILDGLLPELSDTLRRSSFSAMGKAGREVGDTLGRAMVEAVERGLEAGLDEAARRAAEEASRSVLAALLPEMRRLAAAVDSIVAPADLGPAAGHGMRH